MRLTGNEMNVCRLAPVQTLMTRPFLPVNLPEIILGGLKPFPRLRGMNKDVSGRSSARYFDKVQQRAENDHNFGCITLDAPDFCNLCHEDELSFQVQIRLASSDLQGQTTIV